MGTYNGGSPASCDAAFADAGGHSSSSETWPSALTSAARMRPNASACGVLDQARLVLLRALSGERQ